MNIYTVYRTLFPLDVKRIGRDAMLPWLPILPLFMALLMRFGLPPLAFWLDGTLAFDLLPYYPLILSFYVLMVPSFAGMMIGFLLLDEREEHMLLAMQVTPLSLTAYLRYRMVMLMGFGIVMTLVCYPLIGLIPLPFLPLLLITLLGACTGPLFTLLLVTFAPNKIAGLAIVKLINGLMLLPIAAYFFSSYWHWLAGLIPSFWPAKAFWLASTGQSYLLPLLVGLVINILAIWALLRLFLRRMHQ